MKYCMPRVRREKEFVLSRRDMYVVLKRLVEIKASPSVQRHGDRDTLRLRAVREAITGSEEDI